jgi:hypothetical protein
MIAPNVENFRNSRVIALLKILGKIFFIYKETRKEWGAIVTYALLDGGMFCCL